MTTRHLLAAAAALLAVREIPAQEPRLFQQLQCIKVNVGKNQEFRQHYFGPASKVARLRVDAGEIRAWSLLRSVSPSGDEARCAFMISTIGEAASLEPLGTEAIRARWQKAGMTVPYDEYQAKLLSMSHLVANEVWLVRELVGSPKKGDYLALNYMKVHELSDYVDYEHNVWRPMADDWVKSGEMSAWVFSTKVFPSGTETPYAAYSADVAGSWKALFTPRSTQKQFEKVHPGKSYVQASTRQAKLRDLARRELWVYEERIAK